MAGNRKRSWRRWGVGIRVEGGLTSAVREKKKLHRVRGQEDQKANRWRDFLFRGKMSRVLPGRWTPHRLRPFSATGLIKSVCEGSRSWKTCSWAMRQEPKRCLFRERRRREWLLLRPARLPPGTCGGPGPFVKWAFPVDLVVCRSPPPLRRCHLCSRTCIWSPWFLAQIYGKRQDAGHSGGGGREWGRTCNPRDDLVLAELCRSFDGWLISQMHKCICDKLCCAENQPGVSSAVCHSSFLLGTGYFSKMVSQATHPVQE